MNASISNATTCRAICSLLNPDARLSCQRDVASGSVGVAEFGAIYSASLRNRLDALMPPGAELPRSLGPQALASLPAALREHYLNAFAGSMHMV